jgi:hypothetical protein
MGLGTFMLCFFLSSFQNYPQEFVIELYCDVCVCSRWTVMITNHCAPSLGLQDFLPSSGFQRALWNLKSMLQTFSLRVCSW